MVKQGYHFIGTIGVVKRCHWSKEAVLRNRFCYKCLWYGIESHRCIQMSPVAAWCWNRCLHCWRIQPEDIGLHWDETRVPVVDDPEVLVEESIKVHREIMAGFKGNPKADRKRVEEAMNPKHAAISLTGEPLLYPRLGELIKEYHKRGITTFLVTHGTRPDVLANLEEEPTQLFVSLQAPNEKKHKLINRPIVANSWNLIMKTLQILPSFSSPTVIRMTMIKGYNMSEEDAKEFARLIGIAMPTYIEVKAYMHVGPSIMRLTRDAMPSHTEVREFAKLLASYTGYKILSEHVP
ncbi:MAG: 4-demethylwyosine synthase TYW1, partial [Thermogladius sp.]